MPPPRDDGPLLAVRDLTKTYMSPAGDLHVLRGVSLEASAGETVAIIGASGSGKSTLLNLVGSLDKPTSGTIRAGGIDVAALASDALADYRRRRVGFIFQDHHLLPQCTAWENVLLPTLADGPDEEQTARAVELLDRVGLIGRRDDFPRTLSGGERQRVAIARALVNDPPMVLCDEPTGNLDRETGQAVADLFVELAAERGALLLVVTHNAELAARCARRLELRDGVLTPLT